MTYILSFVLLTWNSDHYLIRCLDSIIRACNREKLTYQIIAVDNGSKDLSPLILKKYKKRYPNNFDYIALYSNKGTTLPRNLALKKAKGRHICIIDSDTEIISGKIGKIIELLDSQKQIGIIAPKLVTPDGKTQNSVKLFPTLFQKFLKIPTIFFSIKVKDYDFYDDFPFLEKRYVETAISACWFIRKELLKLIGYFDEKIFYSPEDLDYCMRVQKAGRKILYYPNFTVKHYTQQISHSKKLSKISFIHFYGLLYYFKKHGGWVLKNK